MDNFVAMRSAWGASNWGRVVLQSIEERPIAVSCTLLELAYGWGCQGRRLSRERGNFRRQSCLRQVSRQCKRPAELEAC